MTVSFCIVDSAAAAPPIDAPPGPVTVTQQSVDALRDLLAAHGAHRGTEMIVFDRSDLAHLVYDFDARVCPLSISTVAACFGHDPAVIALVEEAQFQSRCLRIWKHWRTGRILLGLSIRSASGPTPAEAKLVREIAVLEARVRQTERICARSEDYLAMIDWTAMTRDDHETAATHHQDLGWTLYDLGHGIEEASRELWCHCG